jgi:hypothetical protein
MGKQAQCFEDEATNNYYCFIWDKDVVMEMV